MDAPSRYTIHEAGAGLRVEGADRPPVEVSLRPFSLEAAYVGGPGPVVRERFGLFEFGKLLEFVARGLMREWRGNENWYGAREWAQQQTAKALARRLREQWLRMLAKIDPAVLAVQRAVFAATFGGAPLANEPGLYERPYLVADVLRFPAAAVALRNAHQLAHDHALTRLHRSRPAQEVRELAKSLGLSLHVCAVAADEPTPSALLDRLADWKALFSDDGEAYRSLNRTLMNLPGRVPHRLVCNLRRMRLERPLTSRLELLAATLYAGIRAEREDGERRPDQTRLFLHADAGQVRHALERVGRHLRRPLDAQVGATCGRRCSSSRTTRRRTAARWRGWRTRRCAGTATSSAGRATRCGCGTGRRRRRASRRSRCRGRRGCGSWTRWGRSARRRSGCRIASRRRHISSRPSMGTATSFTSPTRGKRRPSRSASRGRCGRPRGRAINATRRRPTVIEFSECGRRGSQVLPNDTTR